MTGCRDPGYRARMAEPGDLLAGRYRLDELIGRGGMATVFRAWDTQLGRPVAVKLLRPEIVTDPDLALRFRREAPTWVPAMDMYPSDLVDRSRATVFAPVLRERPVPRCEPIRPRRATPARVAT